MKTTNEIENQLIKKSQKEIREHARGMVNRLREFGKDHAQNDSNGINWNHAVDSKDFDFLDWAELCELIIRNMERKWLDDMVELKSKQLLSKLDLLS